MPHTLQRESVMLLQQRKRTTTSASVREGTNVVYRYRAMHMVFVGIGAVPFVIWRFASHSVWPDASVAAYLLTALLLLTLWNGYPGPGSAWYWKPVALMILLHTVVLTTLSIGALTIVNTGIRPPTAMFFSVVV